MRGMWVWKWLGQRLFSEDLHGRDGADVRLTRSALCGCTLQDRKADDVTAARSRAVGRTTSAARCFCFHSLGVGHLVRSFAVAGIDHAIFCDFLRGVALVFASHCFDSAEPSAAAEATARWKESGDEAEEDKWDQFFHECLR